MASNSSDSNKKKKQNHTPGSRGSLLNNLAFYAVIFLGIVMIVNAILGIINKYTGLNISTTVTGILQHIAMAIAILITVMASYHVARSKGKNMYILWIVSAVLVVLGYILGIWVL